MSRTPSTSVDAYRELIDSGEDVTIRKKVLAAIAEEPRTSTEVAGRISGRSEKATQPRISELIRMNCVERDGKRTNPSGNDAYIHHVTETGEKYLRGEIPQPEMEPRLSELKSEVVWVARAVSRGEADMDVLKLAVERHDDQKRRLDPDWEPEDDDR